MKVNNMEKEKTDGGTMTEQKPLTIEELKEMAGQPVWCPDEEAYGIVMCDSIGQWAGIPFLHGVWYESNNGCGVEFNHNIIRRKLKCYRVIGEKIDFDKMMEIIHNAPISHGYAYDESVQIKEPSYIISQEDMVKLFNYVRSLKL